MFVCVCHAVCDSNVRDAIEGGARTRDEVTRVCGAGGDCGACHGHIEDMIEEHLESRPERDEQLIAVAALARTRAA
ncbi:MAG TPA: (2Fe-2S)-binding protein [Polyangiaceae bacterium]|jgi:bacterioferritin-associated ferredoxin